MIALFASSTVQTVALGAAILGVLCGTLGCFAVLRRQSLLGDTLAHAALPGVCAGFLIAGTRDMPVILLGALASATLAALSVLVIAGRTRLKTDAALGVVLSFYFAAGIVLLTHIQSEGGTAQGGLATFLFGQSAAMLRGDVVLMAGVAAVVLGLVLLLWKEVKLVTFDPEFARVAGLPVRGLEIGLTVLVAMAIVIGLQVVGVVLMVALLIAPAAAARQWVNGLAPMVGLSALFGAVAGVGGTLISAGSRGLATGPLVVLIAIAIVAVSLLAAPGRGLLARALAERRRARDRAKDHGPTKAPT